MCLNDSSRALVCFYMRWWQEWGKNIRFVKWASASWYLDQVLVGYYLSGFHFIFNHISLSAQFNISHSSFGGFFLCILCMTQVLQDLYIYCLYLKFLNFCDRPLHIGLVAGLYRSWFWVCLIQMFFALLSHFPHLSEELATMDRI